MKRKEELIGALLVTLVEQCGGLVEIPLASLEDGRATRLEMNVNKDTGIIRLRTSDLPLPPGISNVTFIH